jgi:hypothetical protein
MDPAGVIPGSGSRPQGAIGLDEWVGKHGPLWPPAALVIALNICARTSRLTDAELGRLIGSLNMAGVTRREPGGWSWVPAPAGSAAHTVPDTEVIERLGAILFHCLTGQALTYPFPDEQTLRKRLRSLRPELPAGVVDLTVEAVSARRGTGLTLAAFARNLRQVFGVERLSGTRRSRRTMRLLGTATAVIAVSLGSWWAVIPGDQERLEANGLTRHETALLDVSSETAQTFALIDEHTAAVQQYQQIARLWGARVAPDDPRVAWNEAHEAWVRTLAGDRLTTEQLLQNKPSWLSAELGERHPYTRAVRLALAATLDARGATTEAASLRVHAERATRDLLEGTSRASDVSDKVPEPPGVLAHVAPNPPEREGFRRGPNGAFFVPLTSMQRWIIGRDGWRLHLVAAGACRASFIAGTNPRLIAVSAARAVDNSWQVRIEGTRPELTLHGAAAENIGVSLVANGTGAVQARLGDGAHLSSIDAATRPPDPPYTLAFKGGPGGMGCVVVWLEIPFPPA